MHCESKASPVSVRQWNPGSSNSKMLYKVLALAWPSDDLLSRLRQPLTSLHSTRFSHPSCNSTKFQGLPLVLSCFHRALSQASDPQEGENCRELGLRTVCQHHQELSTLHPLFSVRFPPNRSRLHLVQNTVLVPIRQAASSPGSSLAAAASASPPSSSSPLASSPPPLPPLSPPPSHAHVLHSKPSLSKFLTL